MITDNVTGIFRRIFTASSGDPAPTTSSAPPASPSCSPSRPAPGRSPSPTSPPCSPTTPTAAGSPPGSATRCWRVLDLVRAAVRRLPGARHRAADEQAPGVPAPLASPAQAIAAGPSTFTMSQRARPRRAVPGPAAQRHPRRGNRPARRVVPRRPRPGRPPPAAPASPSTSAPTPACTSTSARTSSPCPTRWKTSSPRPAPTGCRSPWPTRTSPSSPPTSPPGISANARSQVIFTASPEDARALERHTLPNLAAHDLSHLGAYQAAARLVAGGGETPAFTFRTQPLPPAIPGRARLIRAAARAAYSGSAARTAAPAGPRGGSDPAAAAPPPPAP